MDPGQAITDCHDMTQPGSANYLTNKAVVTGPGPEDRQYFLIRKTPCPPGNGKSLRERERDTWHVSPLLLSSCQTRVRRKCDSLDTFYGEMIH